MRSTRFLVPAIVLILLAALLGVGSFCTGRAKWNLARALGDLAGILDTRALMGAHVGQTMLEVAIGIGLWPC